MLVDTSRIDPFDPRHRHRRLMIQIWYPAASGGRRAAYMAKGVGRIYAAEYRLPGGTFARVRANAYRNARPLKRPGGYPAILFSPDTASRTRFTRACSRTWRVTASS
jgi:hypothetical protein